VGQRQTGLVLAHALHAQVPPPPRNKVCKNNLDRLILLTYYGYVIKISVGKLPTTLEKTMITVFGKFLRDLRHLHTELLKDMADKLAVSPAFLSAVETGKKSIPPSWNATIVQLYQLSNEQRFELTLAIDQSQRSVTIDLSAQSGERRGVAVALARQFNDLSSDDLDLLKKAMAAVRNRVKDE
jgi:transcriptional regulator with XRE-family HTH domain